MLIQRAVKVLHPLMAPFYNLYNAANLTPHARRARNAHYARYVAKVTPARRLICFIACFSLLLTSQPAIPGLPGYIVGESAEKPNIQLTQGPPGLNLPNLNESRRMNPGAPKIAPPVSAASASNAAPSAPTPAPTLDENWPMALIDHRNRVGSSGEDLLSRNFNWSAPIVSLPGRAGMGVGLGLSLNSLIWTKSGTNIYFDLDKGFPSPGFRLGLPEIGAAFHNTETGTGSILVTMPSGKRYEFRHNPALGSNVYEEKGSTYMLLVVKPGLISHLDTTWNLLLTDGTVYKFKLITNNPKCVEIKDRNGNYASIAYTPLEQIKAITDNLDRDIDFNYDGSNRLISITQNWSGATHTYATFAYENVTIQTNFPGLDLVGVVDGRTLSALSRVDMADGKVYAFEYNTYAQVKTIECYAPNSADSGNFPEDYTLLSSISYDLTPNASAPQSDCPRFSSRTDWAKDWNGGVITTYAGDGATWGEMTALDGTTYKEFFGASNWQRGLTLKTETWSNGSRKKWAESTWVNDNPNVPYWLNPRVIETNIYDDNGNRQRTTIAYADFGAVSEIREYDSPNTSTVLRRTNFEYLRGTAYTGNLNRRLTQLVTSQSVYDGSGALLSKVTHEYDLVGEYLVHQGPPIKHDTAKFGPTFVQGRGNLNIVRRWDVTDPDDSDKSLATTIGYNTSGSVIFSRDPLNHETTVSYADSFSDSINTRNTLAYPTTITDADNYPITIQYNYDFGAVTQTHDPKEAAAVITYDSIGRVEQVTNQVNGAYTRYVYAPNHLSVQTYTTVNDLSSESYQVTVFDGRRRTRATASDHPGSVGGYKAQLYEYDTRGRVVRQTNPTEIAVTEDTWEPAGDDTEWVWSQQEYDWNGRLTVRTDQRGNISIVDYSGCGCAGGEVITTHDEGQFNEVITPPTAQTVFQRRKTRIIHDALGREKKRIAFNWDGNVYTTTTTKYNALGQVVNVKQYKGDGDGVSCPTATCQEGTMSYDGHGRLAARRLPQDDSNTTYTYYANDLLRSSTDARGATGTFTYNNRGLMTNADYTGGNGVVATPSVSFDYDEVGNPRWMDDGPGRVDYNYDTQGRLISETRQFDSLPEMTFQYSYDYNLAGEIKQVTDPRGDIINYGYDSGGSLISVTGSNFAGVTDYATGFQYRAWGQPKYVDYGNSFHAEIGYNPQMKVTSFNIPGVLGANYTLHENGQIKNVQSLIDPRLNRIFEWDHMGRIIESAARISPTNGFLQHYQAYEYDEYGHMTRRSGHYWNTFTTHMVANYSRERATSTSENDQGPNPPTFTRNFQYDAMGNTTQMATTVTVNGQQSQPSTTSILYDAVGRSNPEGTELDGHGRLVKKDQEYHLISTPFGGQVLTLLDSNGQKTSGRVYVGTDLLAEQMMLSGQPSEVVWRHRDPVNTVSRDAKSGGWVGGLFTVDPLGSTLKVASSDEAWTEMFNQGCARELHPGCPGAPPPPTGFYSPNWGTYYANSASGQWAGGCGAFASASVSCGSQMDLFNRMSKDMLEGYQRHMETLINAGFYNTQYSGGVPDLALVSSSLAGVTAAGIGGTYTVKDAILVKDWFEYEEDKFRPFYRLILAANIVPGGAPEPQGGQQGGSKESAPTCGYVVNPKYEQYIKNAPKSMPKPIGPPIKGVLGMVAGVLAAVIAMETSLGPHDQDTPRPRPLTVYRHVAGKKISPSTFRIDPPYPPGTVSTFEHKDPTATYNIPFHGTYFQEKTPGIRADIHGVTEVGRLEAQYTPKDGGEDHWSLLKPDGMSDEAFKKGLSGYAKRVVKGNCP